MDVKTYLQRINLEIVDSINLNFLKKLQKNHLLNIPFENLDIHIGRPIDLDIEKISNKILHNNRGGFCYELNGIFCELLISLGYNAHYISASVFNKEHGFGPELDHMAILVQLENLEYLVDVGFGRFTLEPLKLVIGVEQKDKWYLYY